MTTLMLCIVDLLAVPAGAQTPTPALTARVPAALLPTAPPTSAAVISDVAVLPQSEELPWAHVDPGATDPRSAGCATRTPGDAVSPTCRVLLDGEYGPAATGPVPPKTDR